MGVKEKSIADEIYRITATLLSKPREQLKLPEESCLSAVEEYCKNELRTRAMVYVLRDYYKGHPVKANPMGCLTSIGLLGGTIYGFTQNVLLGLAGFAVTCAATMYTLHGPGRYDMASKQPLEIWEQAAERAKPKLEELLRNHK